MILGILLHQRVCRLTTKVLKMWHCLSGSNVRSLCVTTIFINMSTILNPEEYALQMILLDETLTQTQFQNTKINYGKTVANHLTLSLKLNSPIPEKEYSSINDLSTFSGIQCQNEKFFLICRMIAKIMLADLIKLANMITTQLKLHYGTIQSKNCGILRRGKQRMQIYVL